MILLIGGWLLLLFRGRMRQTMMLILPLLSAAQVLALPADYSFQASLFDYTLTPVRVDRLSLVWAYVFHLATLAGAIYSLHVKDPLQQVAAYSYAGAAIGAVFAGDLITLFLCWELTAVSSVFLIWAGRNEQAYRCGMRYFTFQVLSGVLLLAAAVSMYHDSGSLTFTQVSFHRPGAMVLLIAFGIKSGFPLLHNWMQNAYPESTPTGTVWLSAFTTKLAIYALARAFAGLDLLIWIGSVMVIYPLIFAAIGNNLRRVLVYSLNNQLGFMVIGVGIGTPLAINGVAAHAFCHILYKSLLFMSIGAVLLRVGHTRATDLGGLCHRMPWTTACCLVGAASIAAVPLFSGFVSKTMIISAVGEVHRLWTYLILLVASAGAVAAADLRVPYVTFFGPACRDDVEEAPWNMRIAMGFVAVLCIGIGLFPGLLYCILPFDVEYHPYSLGHVLDKLQLVLFAALAFAVMVQRGWYPANVREINLDTDWFYRRFVPAILRRLTQGAVLIHQGLAQSTSAVMSVLTDLIRFLAGPTGVFARTWSTGGMVLWAAVLLTIYLVVYYLS
jgi:multicomponent Na+:H+ antiporter subunit D